MDSIKMPFIPEETLKTQRVEVYLNDLKNRIKELRLQHDEVIQNSVEIIKEIDDVSSTLLHSQNATTKSEDKLSNIQKLINEFETTKKKSIVGAKAQLPIGGRVNIQKILQNFEQLSESQALKDSLMLFKRAKESLEKIDTIFGKFNTGMETPNVQHEVLFTAPTATEQLEKSLPEQCNLQAIPSDANKESVSRYASCCSSIMSIEQFHSTEDMAHSTKSEPSTTNSLENGYEGDNDDSEYDLFAIKKKKSKYTAEF